MVTYCVMTGARRGILVVPSGHLIDTRPYLIADTLGEIRIEIAELDVSGTSVSAWQENCRALVEKISG